MGQEAIADGVGRMAMGWEGAISSCDPFPYPSRFRGGIEKPPESMQLQQVFYAISVQFLNLYPVANLSTQTRPENRRGEAAETSSVGPK